jgi:hypothetical protein
LLNFHFGRFEISHVARFIWEKDEWIPTGVYPVDSRIRGNDKVDAGMTKKEVLGKLEE